MKQVVVISGGSKGLGLATATLLVPDYTVIILGRNGEDLEAAANKIHCEYYVCDVTDQKQVTETVSEIIAAHTTVDFLINNAGGYISGPVEDLSADDIKQLFAVNVRGVMQLTQAVAPYMKQAKKGAIINVLSTAALQGSANNSLYHATKFAADGFTQSIRKEFLPFNIRVSAIYPGGFGTPATDTTLDTNEIAKAVAFIVNSGPNTVIPQLVIKHRDF